MAMLRGISLLCVGTALVLAPAMLAESDPRLRADEPGVPADSDRILTFQRGKTTVTLDVHEVPELKEWGVKAAELALDWYPRIGNLLVTKGQTLPKAFTIRIIRSEEGVASTSRNVITVSSHWVEKHPDDIGLVIHELTHVVQQYPNGGPGWVTEGIADYIRRAVYEGQPQRFYPVPDDRRGYRQAYNTAAGFLFWLESDRAPGIVKKLNTAMRNRAYNDAIFREATGMELDELWVKYVEESRRD